MQTAANRNNFVGKNARARGFTLIEMMIVLIILVVVIAIVVPVLGGARNAAKGAATRNLMANIQNAAASFGMSERRPAGYFSAKEMGDIQNGDRGLSAMQNTVLDLAGGIVPGTTGASPGVVVDVGPTAATTVRVDIRLVGTSTEDKKGSLSKGYWNPDKATWVAQGGVSHPATIPAHFELPDVVDAWGNPLLAWTQDDAPGVPFSAIASSTRARFYWNSNAAFLKSAALGKGQQDQAGDSVLGTGQTAANRTSSLVGVLGNPGFPDNIAPPNTMPTTSRGSLIIHSAGPNGIFVGFDERGGKIARAGFPPPPPNRGIVRYVANQDPLDNFDDLVSVGGN